MKIKLCIGVYQIYLVSIRFVVRCEIQALYIPYYRASAECLQKFMLEGTLKPFMGGLASRQINFYSCSS